MSADDATVLAARWLRYARGDLDAASALLESGAGEPRHVAGLAQQAAEKAIKAVLVAGQIEFPFTHDLEELQALAAVCGTVAPPRTTPSGSRPAAANSSRSVEGMFVSFRPDRPPLRASARSLRRARTGLVLSSETDQRIQIRYGTRRDKQQLPPRGDDWRTTL